MRRALFIVYDFPPCRAPGPAMRSERFARHLPGLGWRTTVVCRDEGIPDHPDRGTAVVRIPSPVAERLSYQLAAWVWAARIVGPVRSLLREQRFDLVYASCPPFPHALSALLLSRQAGIPLVVDFRDAWSLDPHAGGGRAKRLAKRFLCRWVYPFAERQLLARADEFIANTPSMCREYARALAWPEERIHLLPNGFDEADFGDRMTPPRRERPVFLHCGRFAPTPGRDPDLLLRGVRALVDAGTTIHLRIVGDDSPQLGRAIARLGLEDVVSTRPPVPHPEAIREIRQADVLVVCQPKNRTGITPVAGKTFEYIRSGRPILAIVPPGDNADLVRRYAVSPALVTTFEVADVSRAMQALCLRVAQGHDAGWAGPPTEFAERHDRRHLAAQLSALFDRVAARRAEQRA